MLSHQDFLNECRIGMIEARAKEQITSPLLTRTPVPFSPGMRLQVVAYGLRRKATVQ